MNKELPVVELYTDGSARGNPDGPGGYGYLLRFVDSGGRLHEKEGSQGFFKTTNNRMELMGAIAGLRELTKPCRVTLYSDSKYLTDAFNKNWITAWIQKGWRRGKNEPVKNTDLWKELLEVKKPHTVEFVWVKGHADNRYNEQCDRLATHAADHGPHREDPGIGTEHTGGGE